MEIKWTQFDQTPSYSLHKQKISENIIKNLNLKQNQQSEHSSVQGENQSSQTSPLNNRKVSKQVNINNEQTNDQINLSKQKINQTIRIKNLTYFIHSMDFDFENELQTNQNPAQDNYYQQYCRLFLANIALTNQIKQLIEEKNHLKYRLSKYQDEECYSSFERNQKAKRFRRNAHEIQRFYKCTVKACGKSYGSEGSLNQHYKLKHPEIYSSLPNVQSVFTLPKQHEDKTDKKDLRHDFIRNSNSKVHSILKELGDIKSFKSIKIEELRYEMEENKENKENQCQNIMEKGESKDTGMSSKKGFMTFMKREETTVTDDGTTKLKRSSRTIKKRDFNF